MILFFMCLKCVLNYDENIKLKKSLDVTNLHDLFICTGLSLLIVLG